MSAVAAGAMVGSSLVLWAAPAGANPAPAPTDFSRTTAGNFSVTVPDGACAVRVRARGGSGGSVVAVANSNGGGADISVTYPVVPGQVFSGTVGDGGKPSTGSGGQAGNGGPDAGLGGAGVGDGGRGGTVGSGATHAGAGGGGGTLVEANGVALIYAGGGGASSGGHATNGGFGGNAGLPTSLGTIAPGSNGLDGFDTGSGTPRGGQGGQVAGAGAGGQHTTTSGLSGGAASGRNGGIGGPDPNYDSGGGGGGGYTGGGGGASTTDNGSGAAVAGGNAGGGGGGGSSLVASLTPGGLPGAPTDLSASTGPRVAASHNGQGAVGLVELDWILCSYDLSVDKDVTGPTSAGLTTWTVTVANEGTDDMTRGDVVTLTDTLPGPAGEITGLTTPSGVTCDVAVGDAMKSPIVCRRPFDESAHGGHGDGWRGLDVGESISITYTQTLTNAREYENTATVTDRSNPGNNSHSAKTEVVPPATDDDTTTGPQGRPQEWTPTPTPGTFPVDCAASLQLIDPVSGDPTSDPVVVSGEGTYTVDGCKIVFTPVPSFTGTPGTPLEYQVTDSHGNEATGTYTPTVTPVTPTAADDSSVDRANTPQSVDPLDNDSQGDPAVPLVPSTLKLIDPDTSAEVETVTVPEGVYTIDRTDPAVPLIVFTPNTNYHGTPTPIDYLIEDANETSAGATYQPEVIVDPPATNNGATSGPQGVLQTWEPTPVAGQDLPIDWSTLTLLDGSGNPVPDIVVPNVGTYTVVGKEIHFQPEPGFVGPAPTVDYRISDDGGQHATGTYTPETFAVTPLAKDDSSTGWVNMPQSVDPLGNDSPGDPAVPLVPSTLKLIDPDTSAEVETVTVPEGVYTIDRTDPAAPRIVFTPNRDYTGTPTPVDYVIEDANGSQAKATYRPEVKGAESVKSLEQTLECGTNVVFDMTAEVSNLDPSTVYLLDANGKPVRELKVKGEGTWTVDPKTGEVSFDPIGCFEGDVTPVMWQGSLRDGTPVTGTLDITYEKKPVDKKDDGFLADTGGPMLPLLLLGAGLLASGVALVTRRHSRRGGGTPA